MQLNSYHHLISIQLNNSQFSFHVIVDRDLLAFEYFHSFKEYPMDYHLLRSFTLAMHVPPHDKTLENHVTFPKESENTTLSTCKHCCLNRECAAYTIYYYQCIETSRRPRFKSKLSRTRQKKTGKQTYTDYVVLAIWAIGGQNFGCPVVKMVANATGRVLILLPAGKIIDFDYIYIFNIICLCTMLLCLN